jgi:hypothetical protein
MQMLNTTRAECTTFQNRVNGTSLFEEDRNRVPVKAAAGGDHT